MSNWEVTITSPDGDVMVVHPEHKVTHGIFLTEAGIVGDLIDAPVKTEWDSLAGQEGGTLRGVDREYRDFSLRFSVTDRALRAEDADSRLRMMFDYEEDEWDQSEHRQTRIDLKCVGGRFAGSVRSIYVLMYDTPEHELTRDPFDQQYFEPTVHLRAGQPMWFQDTEVNAWDFTDSGRQSGEIEIFNPTDRPLRHTWIVTGGVGCQFYLPDPSWVGKKGHRVIGGPMPDRVIPMPHITAESGGYRATLDKGKVMVEDMGGTNAMGRMPIPGMSFLHRIPPYTPRTMVPVLVEGAPEGGGRVEVRLPRLWSRPYGMERDL